MKKNIRIWVISTEPSFFDRIKKDMKTGCCSIHHELIFLQSLIEQRIENEDKPAYIIIDMEKINQNDLTTYLVKSQFEAKLIVFDKNKYYQIINPKNKNAGYIMKKIDLSYVFQY